jgi:hypothetical protein
LVSAGVIRLFPPLLLLVVVVVILAVATAR